MNFHQLDRHMRELEAVSDEAVPLGRYIVARLDGRGFGRIVRERFEMPYDERFRDCMVETTQTLMRSSGFRVLYAHTHSDEISLLIHPAEQSFGRKRRKLLSLLAGLASAAFSLHIGEAVAFDCRLVELDQLPEVADYFYWRSSDALRQARNAHCYWALRAKGLEAAAATVSLQGLTVADKRALLARERGVDFDDLPAWQRYGVGLYWEPYEVTVAAPITETPVVEVRRRLATDLALPGQRQYRDYVCQVVEDA